MQNVVAHNAPLPSQAQSAVSASTKPFSIGPTSGAQPLTALQSGAAHDKLAQTPIPAPSVPAIQAAASNKAAADASGLEGVGMATPAVIGRSDGFSLAMLVPRHTSVGDEYPKAYAGHQAHMTSSAAACT